MDIFDKPRSRKRDSNFLNGFEIEQVDAPDYEKMFLSYDSEIECSRSAEKYMRLYDKALTDFETKTSLTSSDMNFLMIAAALQTLRWALISNDKLRFDKASDADKTLKDVGNEFKEFVPASFEQHITDFTNHTVPYDAVARSDRFKSIYPEISTGLSGTTHRYKALGHDPLAGLIVGTANISTNTLTVSKLPHA